MSSLNLFVALFATLLSLALSCSCPETTFEERYGFSDVVVKAKVVAVKRFEPKEPFFAVSYRFKLRVRRTFKGCSPGKVFFAKTMLDGGTCSSVLSKGEIYMIQLPAKPETSDKFPKQFYNFYGCYSVSAWKYVNPKERGFLRNQAKKPENQCSA